MNGNRAFRSFYNSKYIFKSNNLNINSFKSISNNMNNMFHQTMFKMIAISCIKSCQIKQLTNTTSAGIGGENLDEIKISSISETSLIQLIRSFPNVISLSLMRIVSGNELNNILY